MEAPKPIDFIEWKKRNLKALEKNDKICPDCSGSGTIECPTCWGEDEDCKRCVSGETTCDFCEGTGSLNPPLKQYYHKVRTDRQLWESWA